jgi:hypothetical protein
MGNPPLWPFSFEVNLIQRRARRERTVFATLQRNGESHWVDHSGRFGRRGGSGFISLEPGQLDRHFRGNRELTPEEAAAEKDEFTVRISIPDSDYLPARSLIERVGRSWQSGWSENDSALLHSLLEGIYWKHVNRFMHEPFDHEDG